MELYNPYNLGGKTILVTGASSGIGRATAIECSKLGAQLVITGRNEARLKETLCMLEGKNHTYITADLTNENEIERIVLSCPKIDGLVNNAGIVKTLPVNFITEEKYLELFDINQKVPILLMAKLLKGKKISKGASIVFTSSVGGTILGGEVGNSMYGSTKAALSGFVKVSAYELAAKNIRVNAICPGMIETEIMNSDIVTNEQLEENKKKYPLKRFGRPEEVAWAIIYLLSDAASFITGTNLIVDGGLSIR